MVLIAQGDHGHARLIERNIRRAGVNNEIVHKASGTEALCFQITLDPTAPGSLQGKTATATFTLTQRSVTGALVALALTGLVASQVPATGNIAFAQTGGCPRAHWPASVRSALAGGSSRSRRCDTRASRHSSSSVVWRAGGVRPNR